MPRVSTYLTAFFFLLGVINQGLNHRAMKHPNAWYAGLAENEWTLWVLFGVALVFLFLDLRGRVWFQRVVTRVTDSFAKQSRKNLEAEVARLKAQLTIVFGERDTAYANIRELTDVANKVSAQARAQEREIADLKAKLTAAQAELQRAVGMRGRPKVVPVRFGNNPEGRLLDQGLFITNDGEPAYDVMIEPFRVGRYQVSFEGPGRLAKEESFCGVTISDGPVVRFDLGEVLREHMHVIGDDGATATFCIRYRAFEDAGSTWLSFCEFNRDVLAKSGVSVRFVKQEPVQMRGA